ncbi:MAG TPA: hypothetical protein PLA71_00530 [Saccharofermentans sp.]|nr:hypothetical protein [Saccharofermentans sp.]
MKFENKIQSILNETAYAGSSGEKLKVIVDLTRPKDGPVDMQKLMKDIDFSKKYGLILDKRSNLTNPEKAVFIFDNSLEIKKAFLSVLYMNGFTDVDIKKYVHFGSY